jgi:segregation and condensation protein B
VEEVAGGFQMMTRPKFAPWLRRLHAAPTEVRLSAPAMETLAVVAYRQPVLRAEIEAIRGVQSGEVLRQLIERDLVRIAGRSDELGRPFLYGTTKHFLQVFGLRHLDELPNQSLQLQVEQEETNVKTFINKPRQDLVENQTATTTMPRQNDQSSSQDVFDVQEDDVDEEDEDLEDDDDDFDDAEDFEDEDEDEEDEDDEDLDEDLDDEPWEEVEDDDEDEDEDEDDDDWDDDDWDDEDEDDWDDDEDEDEDEEEDKDKDV